MDRCGGPTASGAATGVGEAVAIAAVGVVSAGGAVGAVAGGDGVGAVAGACVGVGEGAAPAEGVCRRDGEPHA